MIFNFIILTYFLSDVKYLDFEFSIEKPLYFLIPVKSIDIKHMLCTYSKLDGRA